jgi:8-oxo-dGTP pyrophosphatase MutT (NUDIX family)
MTNAKPSVPLFATHPALAPYNVPSTAYLITHPTIMLNNKSHALAGLAGATVVIHPPATASHHAQSTQPTQIQTQHRPTPTPHTLLIRRAAHDTAPNKWEVPGGAIDAADASILAGCARELFEEAGLVATRLGPALCGADGPEVFVSSRGRLVMRIAVLAEVALCGADAAAEPQREGVVGDGERAVDGDGLAGLLKMVKQVKLDANEHSAFVWATEEDVRLGRMPTDERLRGFAEGVEVPLRLEFTSRETRENILAGFEAWRRIRAEGDGLSNGAAL